MANEPCFGGLRYVAAPALEPRKFGLFSTSIFVTDNDPHWQQGVQWEPTACESAGIYGYCSCDLGAAPSKTYREGTPLTVATPFTVYGSFKCSPIGRWDDAFERAQAHLLAGEERAVELAIATGTVHTSQAFADASTVDVTPTPGTAVTVLQGFALLEQYLAENYGGTGVIHAAPYLATLALAEDAIVRPAQSDTTLYTGLGTRVAVGGGYDGQIGPNNDTPDPGDYWLYATGRPVIRRSEVWMTPPARENALSTATNDFEVLAERTYAVGWDCVTAAVLVTP